jgi:hypothetical protein
LSFINKEIDIEYSRWGDPQKLNGQFAVQPWNLKEHLHRFEFPATNNPTIHRFRWQNDKATFQVYVNTHKQPSQNQSISDWIFPYQTPKPGRVHPRINLWLFNNQPPSDRQSQVVIIKRFHFSSF